MRVINYREPHSSFLSVDKDLQIIIDNLLKNKNFKKLLHYTTKNALKQKNLTEEERKLINLRYFEDMTQQETANALGMTQVQVSRKETKILKKIKINLAA